MPAVITTTSEITPSRMRSKIDWSTMRQPARSRGSPGEKKTRARKEREGRFTATTPCARVDDSRRCGRGGTHQPAREPTAEQRQAVGLHVVATGSVEQHRAVRGELFIARP